MFKNFIWAFIEKGGQFIIQFLSVVILSRFLTPEEYGTYGIMAIFISVSELLIDSGFGGALVQKTQIDQVDINTLFVSNFGMSLFLYLCLFIAAPFIADYYGIPQLLWYIRVLGLAIIFYALTIVHFSLLQRELRFKKSANITLIASVISVACAVVAAYLGMGIWALIIQPIMMAFSLAAILWLSEKRSIGFSFSRESFLGLWNFGSKLLAANLLQTIYSNVSTSIIPKIASVKVSGFYYQASRLNGIPIGILQTTVDKAAFPILSKEKSRELVLEKARTINKTIVTIFFPFFPILSLFSMEIIGIVLGKQWLEAAPFLSVLAWGGWGLLLQALSRNIYKSIGDTKTILKIDLIKTLLGLSVLCMSIYFGVTFMIWGLTISMYIGAVMYAWHLRKDIFYGFKKQFSDFILPVLTSAITYVLFFVIYKRMDYNWYNITIALAFLIVYIVLNILFKNKVFISLLSKIK